MTFVYKFNEAGIFEILVYISADPVFNNILKIKEKKNDLIFIVHEFMK